MRRINLKKSKNRKQTVYTFKKLVLFSLTVIVGLFLTACDVGPSDATVSSFNQDEMMLSEPASMQQTRFRSQAGAPVAGRDTSFLAYTHRVNVEVPRSDLETAYNKITELCQLDNEHGCTLLRASLSTQSYVNANIQMRIKPEGVDNIKTQSESLGEVVFSETSVEDLQSQIVDNEKRLLMLKQYEQRLAALEKDASADIASLIQIANQMSETQSNIEFAQGQKARLSQRVNMDIVEIRFVSTEYTSFWTPIGNAFGSFGENLSSGFSSVVTAIAFVIPWTLLLLIVLFAIRKVWLFIKR